MLIYHKVTDVVFCSPAVARKHKVRKEEHHRAPRSLFDRPQSLLRKERDLKLKQFAKPMKPQLLQSRPMESVETQSDWLVHEDWALLQVDSYK
jgi:hypothetical protein